MYATLVLSKSQNASTSLGCGAMGVLGAIEWVHGCACQFLGHELEHMCIETVFDLVEEVAEA